MKDYFKVVSVSERELSKFLGKGWELIETVKTRDVDGDRLSYHIGFPLRKAFEVSQELLSAYEKHNLKQQLFEKEANEIGAELSDYESHEYGNTNDSLVPLLEKMDFILTEQVSPRYSKVKKKDDKFLDF